MFQRKIKTNIWFITHIVNLSSFQSGFVVIKHKADKKIGIKIRKVTNVLLNLSKTHFNRISKTKNLKNKHKE